MAKYGGAPQQAKDSHGQRRCFHGEYRRLSSPPGLFEFVHVLGSESGTADDVSLHGRLLHYKPPGTSTPSRTPHHGGEHMRRPSVHEQHRARNLHGRPRGGGTTRYCKGKGGPPALYQKLPTVPEACESRAAKRVGGASPRPGWCVLVLGSVRLPAEMDMRDIRSRLRRRGPPAPVISSGDGIAGDSNGGAKHGSGGGTWKLLRSLSCQGDADGVVAAPLSFGSI